MKTTIEIVEHMIGSGGAWTSREIRAWSGDGALRQVDQFMSDGMGRHTNGDRWLTTGDGFRDDRLLGKQQSQWSRPKSVHQLLRISRNFRNQRLEHSLVANMYN